MSVAVGRDVPSIGTWEATALPEGLRATINRWERLDTARTLAAIAAFSLFLADVALR